MFIIYIIILEPPITGLIIIIIILLILLLCLCCLLCLIRRARRPKPKPKPNPIPPIPPIPTPIYTSLRSISLPSIGILSAKKTHHSSKPHTLRSSSINYPIIHYPPSKHPYRKIKIITNPYHYTTHPIHPIRVRSQNTNPTQRSKI